MEQDIKQMNPGKKRRHSLSFRVLWTTVAGCLILGVVAIAIGLSLYHNALNNQYTEHAFDIAVFAHQSATRGSVDSAGLAEQVMGIYRTLTDEQRNKVGTEEYRTFFSEVDMGKGSAYDVLIHMLATFIRGNEVFDVYLAMYDRDTNALVYVVDPDENDRLYPGDWESVGADEVEKFLTWDGTGMLYHNVVAEKYGWICTSGVPIRDEKGEVAGFVLVDVTTENIRAGMIDFAVKNSLALIAVTVLIAWALLKHIRRIVVRPINALAGAALTYTQDRMEGSSSAGHFSSLNIHSSNEMEHLSLTMAGMENDLSEHEETIKRVAAEKERINTELNLARDIQGSILPMIFPPFPDRTEFSLYASMTPAREVGGDFYDFFLIDSDHLALVIADVSGKGIPASLFMMMSRTLIRNQLMTGCDPAEALRRVNLQLCENNSSCMFVTVWLAVLELSTGRGLACNAGHEKPAVRRAGGEFELLKYKHDKLVGVQPKAAYQNREFEMRPGDCLFVYTDGVPEANNAEGKMFTEQRMIETLNLHAEKEPEELIRSVHDAVDRFADNADQFDDITMLCIRYTGKQA